MKLFSFSSVGEVVSALQSNLSNDEIFTFVVRRFYVLTDALMAMDQLNYAPNRKIDVRIGLSASSHYYFFCFRLIF